VTRRSRDGFYALWTLAIFLSAFVALFAVLFVSCQAAPETAEEQTQLNTEPSGEPEAQAQEPMQEAPTEPTVSATLAQTDDYGPDYLSRFVFLGDGNTYMLRSTGTVPKSQVWSTSEGYLTLSDHASTYILYHGDDGSEQEMLIYNAAGVRQPEYLLINLGYTGLNQTTEAEFKAAYTALIQTIQMASPGTKILCQSILPVMENSYAEVSNGRITTANQWILEVAEQTETRYLNAAELLMDETGGLRSEYAGSDGALLSQAGCEAVLYYVRTHYYQ